MYPVLFPSAMNIIAVVDSTTPDLSPSLLRNVTAFQAIKSRQKSLYERVHCVGS